MHLREGPGVPFHDLVCSYGKERKERRDAHNNDEDNNIDNVE